MIFITLSLYLLFAALPSLEADLLSRLDKQNLFDVKFSDGVFTEGLVNALDYTYDITDADGSLYTCFIPVQEQPDEPVTSRLSDKLETVRTVVANALKSQKCISKADSSYWQYEVCFSPLNDKKNSIMTTVRQYNAGPDGRTAEFILGSAASTESISNELITDPNSNNVLYREELGGGSDGRKTTLIFSCTDSANENLPVMISSVSEPEVLHYEIHVDLSSRHFPEICENYLVSAAVVLKYFNQTCFEVPSHSNNWWSHRVCVGKSITQYHVNAEGKKEVEISLGTYDWKFGEKLDKSGTNPAIIQRYIDGSPCDIRNNEPRETEIRFECSPGREGANDFASMISSITEIETCRYQVLIMSPIICKHIDFGGVVASATQQEIRDISCIKH